MGNKVMSTQPTGEQIPLRPRVDAERELLEATFRWLVILPAEGRPMELARRFPRIANKMAVLWAEPAACQRFIGGLMLDDRGDRAGFPPHILMELAKVETHLDVCIAALRNGGARN